MAEGDNGVYHRARCACFRKTNEAFGGLSNMASGYPLVVNGVSIRSSEALYQACRYPDLPDVQRTIIEQASPWVAKLQAKPFREQSRHDWEQVKRRIMRWCLRVKLAQNWSKFGKILGETGDRMIVEDSSKDDFWGAVPQDEDTLVGDNMLGRLLVELRDDLQGPTAESLRHVEPVPIRDFLLFGEPIQPVQPSRIPSEPLTDPDLTPPETALWRLPAGVDAMAREEQLLLPKRHVEIPAVDAPQTVSSIQPAECGHEKLVANRYPKRLIEVDLPIARISAHARREKSIRHGHISTLHIWWARRPLAACRAVICAALWPDPADEHCPQAFRDAAAKQLIAFAKRVNPERITDEKRQLQDSLSPESRVRWELFAINNPPLHPAEPAHQNVLRFALLDFIADFANWDNSTVPAYLETSRALTQAAHEALGGEPGTRPLVVDPFAGGGSIPLEALRVGADAFASDLNPVAVLLNKVVLEYIPKYGQKLADEVRKWGRWIKEQAEKELAEFYPKDSDGATPIAYLWARTIRCEGAGCGVEVPLMRSLWLAKKANRLVALKIVPNLNAKRIDFQIINDARAKDVGEGTAKRGSVGCPCCGYTTPLSAVKKQLQALRGGAASARLCCVIASHPQSDLVRFGQPEERDHLAFASAGKELARRQKDDSSTSVLMPDESTEQYHTFVNRGPLYGMLKWADYFTPRQGLALTTLGTLITKVGRQLDKEEETELANAVATCLAFALDKCADYTNSVVSWMPRGTVGHLFARQAIPMTWDFPEANPISDFHCSWGNAYEWVASACEGLSLPGSSKGQSHLASATNHPLPNDAAQGVITDPPYYYSVQYADLSDFFYVWLKRVLSHRHPTLFQFPVTPKGDEIIVQSPGHEHALEGKNNAFYEAHMKLAMAEGRRVLAPSGIGVVVFAHTSTKGWESQLQAMVDAEWTITGSWPIDTERSARVLAINRSVLASSVHLVCRPRAGKDVGDWRDVLSELPGRMHEWMPRLASEGVVGADAIFACLGPALEIFSRYSRVEKANGDPVLLREYLEHVWAAVSKEALSTIFRDADASGLEPDARLTAMWLWTVGAGVPVANGNSADDTKSDDEEAENEDGGSSKTAKPSGFTLEFDAARMIAQGLGIHLERSESIVEVTGGKARLLPVAERTKHVFGKDTAAGPTGGKKAKKKVTQPSLFDELDAAEETEGGWKELQGPPPGTTILDRLHQAMILFGAQRGELLKRFLVEDGVGQDGRFWKLAQSLAALYPPGTDERRWVEGVLARKKGLGL